MTIYNMYIFDRHCQCVFYQNWPHRPTSMASSKSASSSIAVIPMRSNSTPVPGSGSNTRMSTSSNNNSDRGTSSQNDTTGRASLTEGSATTRSTSQQQGAGATPMSLEEEAKLVYGVVFSLRNFVKKLSGSQDGFISFRTSTYKLHYYETLTGLKFVINSDPSVESLRHVLHQIHVQVYNEFIAKNPLMTFQDTRWDSAPELGTPIEKPPPPTGPSGAGSIGNELFRVAVDKFIKNLPVFE